MKLIISRPSSSPRRACRTACSTSPSSLGTQPYQDWNSGDSWISFNVPLVLAFWNRTFGGTPSSSCSIIGGGGGGGGAGIAWNSPHQSIAWTVGQQVGLPLGGYLRQVPSAAQYLQSLQVIGQEQEQGPGPGPGPAGPRASPYSQRTSGSPSAASAPHSSPPARKPGADCPAGS